MGLILSWRLRLFACLCGIQCLLSAPALASDAPARPDADLAARLRLYEAEGGASCSHFLADILAWQRRTGDWRDARGKLFGDQPFSVASVGPMGASWDATGLFQKWAKAGQKRGIFFLKRVDGAGYAAFKSRESASPADWPMLVLEYADGKRDIRKPTADTHLDCTTYRAIGQRDNVIISSSQNILIEFSLPEDVVQHPPSHARLVLTNATGQASAIRIGLFDTAVPAFPSPPVQEGLAAAYVGDAGIEKNPDVYFSSGFEEGMGWKSKWDVANGEIDIVKSDHAFKFEPLAGSALRINLKERSNFGSDIRLNTKNFGKEPDELFFRYYLRLADDWNPNKDGGKMPGMAGTYNRAGWGGRRSDGTNGWSARGGFLRIFEGDHPMRGLTQLVTYAYHADMEGAYGDHWTWPGALLERNRWYCVEQQIALNHPGKADGVLRVWLDGRMIVERTDVRYRSVDSLHIEDVWINVYHGGIDPSPHDQHLFVDNVVIARKYIGPMGKAR